jgi:HemY protein
MIRLLVLLAILVVLAFGGTWLAERPGAIVMTVEGRQIQMTLGVGAALLAAIVVAAVVLWSVLRFLLRLPGLLSFTNKARRRARGFAAVSRGMVAVGAGDPRSAKRHASDASRLLGDDEPLALLLKAQTAQMTGDRGSAEGAFRQMLDEPETRVLGLRGLFVEARRKGDFAAARAYAAEAARLAPSVSWAGEAVLEYQCSEQDWTGALATLERASRGFDKAALRRQRAVLLTADAISRQEREPDAALARAQEALKLAPDLVPAAVLAGRLLSRRGDYRKASKTIEASWKLTPHPELADAYVHVRPGDSARDRVARAQKLQGLRPQAAEGRVALAEAALAGRDFPLVRQALAPLLEGRPSISVCLLMADLAEADETANGSVREWLARASRAPRDPAWIADGVISDTWAPVSPVTGRLDAFTWGTPVEQIALSPRDADRAERAAAAALPHHDDVLADIDEPEALLDEGRDASAAAGRESAGEPLPNAARKDAHEPMLEARADRPSAGLGISPANGYGAGTASPPASSPPTPASAPGRTADSRGTVVELHSRAGGPAGTGPATHRTETQAGAPLSPDTNGAAAEPASSSPAIAGQDSANPTASGDTASRPSGQAQVAGLEPRNGQSGTLASAAPPSPANGSARQGASAQGMGAPGTGAHGSAAAGLGAPGSAGFGPAGSGPVGPAQAAFGGTGSHPAGSPSLARSSAGEGSAQEPAMTGSAGASRAAASPSSSEPVPAVPSPTVEAATGGGPPSPSPLAATAPSPEARRRPIQPTPVVFPLAAAPDDPGPENLDPPARGRVTFLQ